MSTADTYLLILETMWIIANNIIAHIIFVLDGISEKNKKPKKACMINSRYLIGANWDSIDRLKAINKKYCINWPQIPRTINNAIVLIEKVNFPHPLQKEKDENIVAYIENENSMLRSHWLVRPIFLIMTSWNANNIAAVNGRIYR